MSRRCLFLLFALSVLLSAFAFGGSRAQTPDGAQTAVSEDDVAVRNSLARELAMAVARDHLRAGEPQKAIAALEAELAKVNGHSGFLRLLRDAYRAHIQQLWLSNRGAEANRYLERLAILDPASAKDPSLKPETKLPIVAVQPPAPAPVAFPNYAQHYPKPNTVRAKPDDFSLKEDPFDLSHQRALPKQEEAKLAQSYLRLGDDEFQRKRFGDARRYYEKAYQADRDSLGKCKERWAYCLLDNVVDQLNQAELNAEALQGLSQQVKGALTMAPNLNETGRWLLGEIEQRRKAKSPEARNDAKNPEIAAAEPTVQVKHVGRNPQGWEVAETTHFLIFHNQSHELVEKVARVAETTRLNMTRKWFGHDGEAWNPKCELILHANGNDYTRMTGVPSASPGHTRIESDGERVVARRMDLRCDNPAMVEAILPHETTHVVLAGKFGRHQVPRWADEGIAVLSEPQEKIEQHRRNLNKAGKDHGMFGLRELMEMRDYPSPARIQAFYAQSVCLTQFLSKERGPTVFTTFVREGLRDGYEAALRRHYSSDFSALEQRWQEFISGQRVAAGQ